MLPAVFAVFLALAPQSSERMDYVLSKFVSNGFSRQEAAAFFQDPRLKLYPTRIVQPRKIDWDKIIARLVSSASVKRGKDFLLQHHDPLLAAEEKFGVPKEVIAALLGLESNFGKNTGSYTTFNIFYTSLMRREEEKRWKWAGDNLASLAAYCRNINSDCFEIQGSYGGALGPAQFLPQSVENFGYDGNGDSLVNPFDIHDAIFSAANFLVKHGWHEGHAKALGRYYGSSQGYPRAVLAYAEAIQQ